MNVQKETRSARVIPDKDCRAQWFQKRHPKMPAIHQSLRCIQVCVFRNCVIKNATSETQFAHQNMPDLQPSVYLAEEVGKGLGSGQVLLRRMQRQAKSNMILRLSNARRRFVLSSLLTIAVMVILNCSNTRDCLRLRLNPVRNSEAHSGRILHQPQMFVPPVQFLLSIMTAR